MGAPFSDITLYTPAPYQAGTPEYWEDRSLKNFVSDLYMQKMHGYKPPKTSRITVQPAYHDTWNRTWKNGSIVTIAPYYNHDEYPANDKKGKYMYILDLIQRATIPLSEEYNWDKSVFERAYREVLECDFKFRIEYPAKQSRDKRKVGRLIVEKTETITSVLVSIDVNGSAIVRRLFDKKNLWWYDGVYMLARFNKWFDTDRFGIGYRKGKIESWYSIERDEVALLEGGRPVKEIEFKKHFLFG